MHTANCDLKVKTNALLILWDFFALSDAQCNAHWYSGKIVLSWLNIFVVVYYCLNADAAGWNILLSCYFAILPFSCVSYSILFFVLLYNTYITNIAYSFCLHCSAIFNLTFRIIFFFLILLLGIYFSSSSLCIIAILYSCHDFQMVLWNILVCDLWEVTMKEPFLMPYSTTHWIFIPILYSYYINL